MARSLRKATFGESLFVIRFLTEAEDFYDELKTLAREDVSVLKNLVNVQRLYRGDDPQLAGKESKLALGVILQKLYLSNPKAALYLGKLDWEPELVNWVGFLDQIGDKSLAEFLGISDSQSIPVGKAGGLGDGVRGGGDALSDLFDGDDTEVPEEDGEDDILDYGPPGEEDDELPA